MCLVLLPTALCAQSLTFSVLGDTPYEDDELLAFQENMLDHNLYSPADFLVHVGDIFGGGTPCDEYRYQQVADALRTLSVPAFIVPGDNETKDCDDQALGFSHWQTHFQGLDQNFCGTPAVQRQTARPENFAFVSKGVLFIGLHLLGGSGSAGLQQDDADWVEQHLLAQAPFVRAAVIFSHTGPDHGSDLFFDQFLQDALAFGKPVLYVHGHGHSWIDDMPFGVSSIRRIQVKNGDDPPVAITVTTDSPARFTIDRSPFDGSPSNATPCVDAGPDLWIGSGQQAWLRGMADDDRDPGSSSLSLTWSKVSGPGAVSFTNPNDAQTFVSFGSNGTYSLQLRGTDGLLTASDQVTVVVSDDVPNDPPVASNDSYAVTMGQSLQVAAPGLLANDSDPNGTALSALAVSAPTHGSLSLQPDGSFTYVPAPGFHGFDSFTYRVTDGLLQSAPAGVSINVAPVTLTLVPQEDSMIDSSDPERVYGGSSRLRVEVDDATYKSFLQFQVDGTGSTILSAKLRLFATNGGPDGGSLHWISNYVPGTTTVWTEGTLNWNNAPALAGTPIASLGEVDEDEWVEFDVSPAIRGDGTYSFGIQNVSSNRVEYSSKEGDEAPVLLIETVSGGGGQNHAPQALDDPFALDEDTSLTLADPGVLGNDGDVDGDALRVILTSSPTQGSLNLSPGGGFTYTPRANANGPDSFAYVADDHRGGLGPALVTLQIRPINDPPWVEEEHLTLDEDVPLELPAPGVLLNDSDPDGDGLTVAVASPPTRGSLLLHPDGGFTYTPSPDQNGQDQFTYTVSDGQGGNGTGTVTLDIRPVQDPPRTTDDTYSTDEDMPLIVDAPGILQNDSDVEGDPLSASLDTPASHGTVLLAVDGGFTYSPDPDFNGTDAFTVRVSDSSGASTPASVTLHVSPRNDAPWARADTLATDEDVPLLLAAPGILANDTDIDGDPMTAALVEPPARGALSLAPNGSLTYTPGTHEHGVDLFRYRASDANGGSDTTTVVLTVRPVNDAPVAAADTYSTSEDIALVLAAPGFLENDTDADGDPLTASLLEAPAHGSLQWEPDGGFTYIPAANFHGTDHFTYAASDGQGGTATAEVLVQVTAVNDAPVAGADAFALEEDTPLVVPSPGVLANDGDVDGDPLTVLLVTPPQHGAVTLSANGSFTYAPSADYFGMDAFTYRLRDPSLTEAVGTVNLTIHPVNDGPVSKIDSYSTPEDVTLAVAAPGILANDFDVEGDVLQSSMESPPSHGLVTLRSDGSFDYLPSADYHGEDSFTYSVVDPGGGESSAAVNLVVTPRNDDPVASDEEFETDEDGSLDVPAPGILRNVFDVDGDSLVLSLDAPPSRGTLELQADGRFRYTPQPDFHGLDAFAYRVTDPSGRSDSGTVTLRVRPINDEPLASPDAFDVLEDGELEVAAPGILGNDVDVDGDALTVTLSSAPAHGTLSLSADGGLSFQPDPDFHGDDAFTYAVSDGQGGMGTGSVTIHVASVNDAPTTQDDAFALDEDEALVVPEPGVLGNDADVDGDILTLRWVQGPLHGSLTLHPKGSFIYTPGLDFHGTDRFDYEARDGQGGTARGVVTLTVLPVNDPPRAMGESFSTDEDATLVLGAPGVLENDSDVDGDVLQAVLAEPPIHGTLELATDGAVSYVPTPDYFGSDRFTYVVRDAHGEERSAEASIEIRPVNDPPAGRDANRVTDEDVPLQVPAPGALTGASDADGDPLQAMLAGQPAHGSVLLATDGAFTYTPHRDFHGLDPFRVTLHDGHGGTGEATIHIEVRAVQDAPTAGDDVYTLDEDEPLILPAPGPLSNDHDVDGDALVASVVTSPEHGALQLLDNGQLTYIPQANFHGEDAFTYAVDDGFQKDEALVSLVVISVNDAPLATDDTWNGVEDESLFVAAPGPLRNDTDVDGDVLRLRLETVPAHGAVQAGSTGEFTYVPDPDFHGVDGFTYVAFDGQGGESRGRVVLHLEPRPDAPRARPDVFVVDEDAALDLAAPGPLANDVDVDMDSLHARVGQPPAHGSLTLEHDGSLHYVPDPDWAGTDHFTYFAVDATGLRDSTSVEIHVTAVNDAPAGRDDRFTLEEDRPLAAPLPGVLGNDTDVDGDTLQARLASPAAEGDVDLRADGSFLYTPAADFFGSDRFEYFVSDGQGGQARASVHLQVSPVNDAPRAVPDSFAVFEDDSLRVVAPGVLGNDVEVEAEPMQALLDTPPTHGSVSLWPDGSFLYVPNRDFAGWDWFDVIVSDPQGATERAPVILRVQPLNDAPRAAPDSFVVLAGTPFLSPAEALLANDVDADGDTLYVRVDIAPQYGELDLLPQGTFRYTATAGFTGSDAFTYIASDGLLEHGAGVSLRVQGRGVTYEGSVQGSATDSDVVQAPAVLAAAEGDLYLAALSSRPARPVSRVTGLGLDWVPLPTPRAGPVDVGLEIWVARGAPMPEAVRARFDAPVEEAGIVVTRYSGVDASDPIGSMRFETPAPGVTTYDVPLTTLTEGGMVYRAVTVAGGDHEFQDASFARSRVDPDDEGADPILATDDRAVDAGVQRLRGRFGASSAWCLMAVEIRSHRIDETLPLASRLEVMPNPAGPHALVAYTLYRRARVELQIFDARGRLVRHLLDDALPPGRMQLEWDSRDGRGRPVDSGVYFLRLCSEGRTATRKLVILR